MKTLHLLRHAKAEPAGEDDSVSEDHERPLAKRGRKAADALAEHLRDEGFAVDRVFCSTAKRARETIEPLRRVALVSTPVVFRDSLYMIETDALLDFVRGLPEATGAVMLVGHNPTFHLLANLLVSRAGAGAGEAEALKVLRQKFPTGALCSIECRGSGWSAVGPGCGTLTRFLRPKDLSE